MALNQGGPQDSFMNHIEATKRVYPLLISLGPIIKPINQWKSKSADIQSLKQSIPYSLIQQTKKDNQWVSQALSQSVSDVSEVRQDGQPAHTGGVVTESCHLVSRRSWIVGAVTSYSVSHQKSKFRSASQSVSHSASHSVSQYVFTSVRSRCDQKKIEKHVYVSEKHWWNRGKNITFSHLTHIRTYYFITALFYPKFYLSFSVDTNHLKISY